MKFAAEQPCLRIKAAARQFGCDRNTVRKWVRRYDPKRLTGTHACPLNSLYWHFLMRHREPLADNPRMRLIYAGLARMSEAKREAITQQAEAFLARLACDTAPRWEGGGEAKRHAKGYRKEKRE